MESSPDLTAFHGPAKLPAGHVVGYTAAVNSGDETLTGHCSSLYDLLRLRDAAGMAHIDWHATLGSTNDRALHFCQIGDLPTPALVLADEQTAGRGRGTNQWWSGRGAILCSLVIDPDAQSLETNLWPRVSLAVAVGICRAVTKLAPHVEPGLRWPNDVYVGERKLGGILVESPAAPAARRRLVIGFGVNVNNSWREAPAELRHVGVSLVDLCHGPLELTGALVAVLHEIGLQIDRLSAGDPELPDEWQFRCLLTGRLVEIECGARRVVGSCQGVDVDGGLLLATDAGVERFHAGALKLVQ